MAPIHEADNNDKTSGEPNNNGGPKGQTENRRPVASFSMAAALNMVKRRQEELKKAKEDEEKNLEQEKKEKAREKRRRRRKNQKLAKSKAKAKLLVEENDDHESDIERESPKNGEEEEELDGKQPKDETKLKRDSTGSDDELRTNQLPAKKRFKVEKSFGEVSVPEEISSDDAPQKESSISQLSSRFSSLIPRALMIKKKAAFEVENK